MTSRCMMNFLQTIGNDQAVTYELQQAGAADAW